jgi:2,4-dienoyl-CoA reductase (NADPH2)
MKKRDVEELSGCKYLEINDNGLLIERNGKQLTLSVDTVVICAGQVSLKTLFDPLLLSGKKVFLIGGAQEAGELDAKRAIDQGTRLAANIENARAGEVFEAPVGLLPQLLKFLEGFSKRK